MAKRPEGDLGAMAISKAKAAETMPFGKPAPVAPAPVSAKSLTVKLDGDLYAELRTYCYEHERSTGTRLTHQQVMVEALKAYLAMR
jgi:hypothetical protein